MEIPQETLNELAACLEQTTSHLDEPRMAAQAYLEEHAGTPGFAPILLQMSSMSEDLPLPVLQAAAVNLKNWVQKYWVVLPGEASASGEDREMLKQMLVPVLVTVLPQIRRILVDVVLTIGKADYPKQWEGLMPEIVARLGAAMSEADFDTINSLLEIVKCLFSKYEGQFTDDALLTEMIYSLEQFQEPLHQILEVLFGAIEGNAENTALIDALLNTLGIAAKIFYSLNCHEFPAYFDIHMDEIMTVFSGLLAYENQAISTASETEPSSLVRLQATLCSICKLLTETAEDEFNEKYLPTFIDLIWRRLMSTSPHACDDDLVMTAMGFLSAIAGLTSSTAFLQDAEALAAICEHVVIPNIAFRELDLETFECDPAEFLRRTIEDGDGGTRRRAAADLIKSLFKQFREPVTNIFSGYVVSLLETYSQNPAENWMAKDSALFLVESLTVITKSSKFGVNETNEFVDLADFVGTHVLPELAEGAAPSPVIQTSALRFLAVFRNQLPEEMVLASMGAAVPYLGSPEYLVSTVAAYTVASLCQASVQGRKIFTAASIAPQLGDLFAALFGIVDRATNKFEKENAHVMKALMRIILTAKGEVMPYVESCIAKLTELVGEAAANPGDPSYNKYLFESISALVHNICKQDPSMVTQFEALLFPPFQQILQAQVEEFSQFVFQIMSQTLVLHSDGIPEAYMAMLTPLMSAELWEQTANIPAMTRLLQAYLTTGASQVIAAGALEPILGIWRHLVASLTRDHYGMQLLNTIVEQVQPSEFAPHMDTLLNLLFTRLGNSKTTRFEFAFINWCMRFAIAHEPDPLIQAIETLQPGLWRNVLTSIILDKSQALRDPLARKIASVGMIKLLASPAMVEGFSDLWGPTLNAVVTLFEGDIDTVAPSEIDQILDTAIPQDMAYNTAFAKLSCSGDETYDPCAAITDPRGMLVEVLAAAPAMGVPLAQVEVNDDVRQALAGYWHAAGVQQPCPW